MIVPLEGFNMNKGRADILSITSRHHKASAYLPRCGPLKGPDSASMLQLTRSTYSVSRDSQIHSIQYRREGNEGYIDAEADMLSAETSSAICVQRLDDSRNSAIHTTYRISLRSSSLREPRYPLLRVILVRRIERPSRLPLYDCFR